jgi:hypothetical protein
MPSYLDRYRNGECEQVWAELLAAGARVRGQPLCDEALAVARETMRRARANIELLVPRLQSLGYQFAHPDQVFIPADEESRRLVSDVERRAGPLPLALRVWCEEVGEVNFMGSHPKLSAYVQSPSGREMAEGFLSLLGQQGGPAAGTGDPLRQAVEASRRLLDDLVKGIKAGQPRSPQVQAGVQASKQMLERLQRPTAAPAGPDVDSDPLVVEPYFGDLEEDLDDDGEVGEGGEAEPGEFSVMIAPDPVQKTGHSGGGPYIINIPDPAIDAVLEEGEDYGTFVGYLRTSFRWGGFPGLRASKAPPREELEFLTRGLSPL